MFAVIVLASLHSLPTVMRKAMVAHDASGPKWFGARAYPAKISVHVVHPLQAGRVGPPAGVALMRSVVTAGLIVVCGESGGCPMPRFR